MSVLPPQDRSLETFFLPSGIDRGAGAFSRGYQNCRSIGAIAVAAFQRIGYALAKELRSSSREVETNVASFGVNEFNKDPGIGLSGLIQDVLDDKIDCLVQLFGPKCFAIPPVLQAASREAQVCFDDCVRSTRQEPASRTLRPLTRHSQRHGRSTGSRLFNQHLVWFSTHHPRSRFARREMLRVFFREEHPYLSSVNLIFCDCRSKSN